MTQSPERRETKKRILKMNKDSKRGENTFSFLPLLGEHSFHFLFLQRSFSFLPLLGGGWRGSQRNDEEA
jgi:hypothetical protein